MSSLDQSRQKITEIDQEMARLFSERMQACQEIAFFKKENGLPIVDPRREADLIQKNRSLIENASIEGYYVEFLKHLMSLSCQYQSRLIHGRKVAYSGVVGAFGYMAAKQAFPEADFVAYDSFEEAYRATENGLCDCAVLPLENSSAGEVGAVMDLLFSGSLSVNRVIPVPVTHHLLAKAPSSLRDITTIVSHPQALEQCKNYIQEHHFQTIPYANTAMAAQYVQEANDPHLAAIASEETASLYGLEILDKHIQATDNNTTRFAVFSRSQHSLSGSTGDKGEQFILVFTVRNEAGALAQTLNIIGAHGFNMRTLRSRPMKGLLWNYFFYIEADGNIHTPNGKAMLQELSALCANLKLVGTYDAKEGENHANLHPAPTSLL